MKNILIGLLAILFVNACSSEDSGLYVEETGSIEMVNVVISSKSNGTVTNILKDEGSFVNTGDTILIIDTESLILQLKQAEALKEIAEAQLELLQNGARSEDKIQAEEMVKQARSNFESAKTDKERFSKLFEEHAITEKQFNDISTRFDLASAQLTSAEANYKKVQKIARNEEIKAGKAKLDQSQANVDLIKKSIRDSYIISPIDGQIVKTFIEIGETVVPMSSLVKISNTTQAEMIVYVTEKDLAKVKLGQKAEIKIDAFPDKSYEGIIKFISPESEFTPKNIQTKDERTKLVYSVKIEIPNPDYELKAGMPADAKIFINN